MTEVLVWNRTDLRPADNAALAALEEAGIELGTDYPRPVVDFERRAGEARDRFARLAERAREAIEVPDVRRRASLSRRGRERLAEASEKEAGQAGLDDF